MCKRYVAPFLVLVFLSFLFAPDFHAAGVGQIKGTITDAETGEPVVNASVLIVGTKFGAITDSDGKYAIPRLQPDTYTVRISSIDYNSVEVTDVIVETDLTTEVSQQLTKKVDDIDKTIKVVGKKDVIDRFSVENKMTITSETIKHKPVQTVDALLDQVAGVQTTNTGEVFVRGGRGGEYQYIIDGKPNGNPRGGAPLVHGGSAPVNDAPYTAMFFKDYGVNPFVDTEDDHLSTFAVDVDDASFIMTRSYIERGSLPPEEAVRAEEFINHFDYGYDPPRRRPFNIHCEGAPSYFGTDNMHLLRIGIKGRVIPDENRKPANLVFVIDVSGSMGYENRLETVKKALKLLVEELKPGDRVAIVVYGSRGEVVLKPTSIDRKVKILAVIESLRCGGSTNAEEGIRLGYQMADRMFDRRKINRVILCSDGVANVGRTGPDQILAQIKKYADRGVTLSTVGFGMGNYNDILMEKLGNKGNGHYAYVDDIDEARRIFVDNLTGTLEVIARDVKIQVDFDPEVVRSYRLIGYENRDVADKDFRVDTVDGGEIGSGHSVTALYEFKYHKGAEGKAPGEIFVRYKDPYSREVDEVSRIIGPEVFQAEFADCSPGFKLAAAAAEFSEILRNSYWSRESDLRDVLALTIDSYIELEQDDALDLARLISQARRFKRELARK